MRPSYVILEINLATARSRTNPPELPPGAGYTGVAVRELPAGSVISIAFGQNAPMVALLQQGESFEFRDLRDCPLVCTEGLEITNTAGAGTVRLLVSMAGSGGGGGVGVGV